VNDLHAKLVVTVLGFILTSGLGWVASAVLEHRVQITALQGALADADDERRFIRKQMLKLHPMQRSALAAEFRRGGFRDADVD
jgi:butyrate kinase